MSRAPIIWIILGKMFANVSFFAIAGVLGFSVVFVIDGTGLEVGDPLLIVPSVAVAVIAVIATAFLFAPFTFLLRGQPGFFTHPLDRARDLATHTPAGGRPPAITATTTTRVPPWNDRGTTVSARRVYV